MRQLAVVLIALVLASCGGSYDYNAMQEYVDKCIIEAGPQTERNNITDYCDAKWRQSQREK